MKLGSLIILTLLAVLIPGRTADAAIPFPADRYDRPWEDVNVFAGDHVKPWARDLMRRLLTWDGCTPALCRAAAR